MPTPRLIYPMLDNFLLGEEISEHHGVRCYPAIRRNTDEKYILKVISVPASQVQVDALLITGALSGREAAQEYFNRQAADIVRQSETLRQLSHQEGFVPYIDAQVVPMEHGIGCEVYLLGTYKTSVEKILASESLTQLGVVRMALDLCAALAACRRAGYLYVDLQPDNIFHTEEQGYRIGDIGFLPLSSLKFSTLSQKYRSCYTAPEMADDLVAPNSTLDVYALGMILYQAYNGGSLPFDENAPAALTIPPLYADYEMAEIIFKACSADPADRWQDPTQLAQALVDYMQRNEITDAPIIPLLQPEAEEEEYETAVEEFLPEADPEELMREMEQLQDADAEELPFLIGSEGQMILSDEESESVDALMVSEDISDMLAQADDLISHTLPEPVVPPEAIHVPMPEPILVDTPEEEPQPEPEEEPMTIEAEPEVLNEPQVEPETPTPEPTPVSEPLKKTKRKEPTPVRHEDPEDKPIFHFPWRIVAAAALVILVLVVAVLGGDYYNNQYLQNIDDLTVTYEQNQLTVQVVTDMDQTLLTVVCTDSYGNINRKPLENGIALFTDLTPQTHYTIRLEVSGSHKLTGKTSETFSTPAQTQILTLTAGIGSTDGSVVLDFTASGPKVDRWVVTYAADGEPSMTKEFSGNQVTVDQLVIGKEYTFTLSDAKGVPIAGKTQICYVATPILLAQDLKITACGGGTLSVQWSQPEGYHVEKWTLHCYNGDGYDRVIVTSDLSYTFTGLTHDTPCTVDVTAVGMNQGIHNTISANPITVHHFEVTQATDHQLQIRWNFSGNAPENGWILYVVIDGCEQLRFDCSENTAMVPAIPGASYSILVTSNGSQKVFDGNASYTHAAVENFQGYGIQSDQLQWKFCPRPEGDSWRWQDVAEENFTNAFSAGQQIGCVIYTPLAPEASEQPMHIQYVLHDSDSSLAAIWDTHLIWNEMWQDGYCQLDIPSSELTAGSYTLTIYFDGYFAYQQEITIL